MTTVFPFPRDSHSYSADEVGRALAGLFARETTGIPRVGVLGSIPSVKNVAGTWKVEVGVFAYVNQVDRSVQISGLSSAEQHDITPAAGNIPAGQARIDLVAWDPVDAEIAVIPGTPAASPSVPSAPGFAPLATVRVNSGDGVVIGSQISIVAQTTDLVGSSGVDGEFTPGTGWAVEAGEESSLERIGRVVYLNTLLRISAPGAFTSILTVPPAFRPAKDVFVGYAQVSGGAGRAHGQLWLRTTGVLQMRYYQGSTNAGNLLPVSAIWRLPKG